MSVSYTHLLKKTVTTSADPFVTALKLAIAGNIIDYGIPQHFDLDETIGKVLASDFAIDHSKDLKQSLSEAKSVLYIGCLLYTSYISIRK